MSSITSQPETTKSGESESSMYGGELEKVADIMETIADVSQNISVDTNQTKVHFDFMDWTSWNTFSTVFVISVFG